MSSRAKVATSPEDLVSRVLAARQRGFAIVLTNGAFDLLHVGHVRALEDARSHGGFLVVGINSDASVRSAKGSSRPVLPAVERAEIVAALGCVDAVFVFDAPTVEGLLRLVRPDIHAKGRDYTVETVPERSIAAELGARVVIVGDAKEHATTDVIARIRALPAP